MVSVRRVFLWALVLVVASVAFDLFSPPEWFETNIIELDETVILFHNYVALSDECASSDDDSAQPTIDVPIHGWIFEPEHDSLTRKLFFETLKYFFEFNMTKYTFLEQRSTKFFVDNERGKRISIGFCGVEHELSSLSGRDGHFRDSIRLPCGQLNRCLREFGAGTYREIIDHGVAKPLENATASPKWLGASVTNDNGVHKFEVDAAVQVLPEDGISVISDIDDTIKITGMELEEVLLNTFSAFKYVDGTPEMYARWSEGVYVRGGGGDDGNCEGSDGGEGNDGKGSDGGESSDGGECSDGTRGGGAGVPLQVSFHYVSGSPYQLYRDIEKFLLRSGFPMGSIHLRNFRMKDSSGLTFISPPDDAKREAIGHLLETTSAKRRFVMVGDSTQHDPEIYGEFARKYPDRVLRILIRCVPEEDGRLLTDHTTRRGMTLAWRPRSRASTHRSGPGFTTHIPSGMSLPMH